MKKVIVYRTNLLPGSETFIKEQILALTRWEAVLTGLRFVPGLDLSQIQCELLAGSLPSRVALKLATVLRELDATPWGVRGKLERLNGSVVHVHFATDLVAIWPAIRSLGLPIITTLHGYDINIFKESWHRGGGASRLYPDRLVSIAKHSRVRFIAVSEAIRQRAIEYGIPSEKVVVKYIGIDSSRFAPSGYPTAARRRRILFVGRMVEKKGADILIKAFARIRQQVCDAELVMIGDGPLMTEHMMLARSLNAPVTFMGAQSSDAVKRQIDEARVLCLPSVTARNGDAEGLPMVLLEAQACGVPVVTSARGGATEGIIDNVTGFAFPENDAESLEGSLLRVLRDDGLVTRMSYAARRHVTARFDLQRCTRALEDFYEQCATS